MSNTSIYLPEPLVRRLDEVAEREDRSRSYVVSRALEEWLNRAIGHARAEENSPERKADAAAREHLREHRRLSGLGGGDE